MNPVAPDSPGAPRSVAPVDEAIHAITPALLTALFGQYRMSPMGVHGLAHWARVLDNGLQISRTTEANPYVVALFAVFHDACRLNDHSDPGHGPRAAALVEDLAGLIPVLSRGDRACLAEACTGHTRGKVHDDPTIGACWDADRLDLARVGITPKANYLSTAPARDPSIIAEATARAVEGHIFPIVPEVWLPLVQGPGATT
jgi:uncharacterized protein